MPTKTSSKTTTKMSQKYSTKPTEVDSKLVIAENPKDVLKILDTYGVAVIALTCDKKELDKALKATKFYNTATQYLKTNLR